MSPRVALVVSTTAEDPGPLLAARLRHLLGLGWDARLFCKGEARARDPALRDPALGGHVELAPRAPAKSSPFDRRLLEFRPDLIHFHSGRAAWKGIGLRRSLGCHVVITLREDGQDLRVPEPKLLWEAADVLLFPSAAALERAAEQGWPREHAQVLHAPVVALARLVRREPPPGFLRVLSAGSLVWEQGFEHSVHAVRLLLDMGVGCQYRILGEGDHAAAVAFARHQLGLADHVELLSPDGADGLAEQLQRADVFVDPAVTDTNPPTALVSALVWGVPFVATARAGLPEEAGIAVPRRNPTAIAQALARLAASPDLRARMGKAAQRTRGQPTLEDHLRELEDLYLRALG